MPKQAQPWYRKGRGWYIEFNKKQTFLGKDRGDAFRAFYALMAGNEQPKNSVREVVNEFSKWVDANRSPKTAKWYKDTLQRFLKFQPGLSVQQLKPFHVQQWMDASGLSNGTKRNYCRVMQRCMKWAEDQGYIEQSPIRNMKKPPPTFRDVVISEAEYKRILYVATTIKPLIEFAWETGARASEIIKLRWEYVHENRIILPRSEEKMKRTTRIIYLSRKAQAILKRQRKGSGFIFRNSLNGRWTIAATNCAFFRMKKKLENRQYCLTHFRHAFAHRLLSKGTDALSVAALMGHSDVSMVAKCYGHINHAVDHLASALEKAAE